MVRFGVNVDYGCVVNMHGQVIVYKRVCYRECVDVEMCVLYKRGLLLGSLYL